VILNNPCCRPATDLLFAPTLLSACWSSALVGQLGTQQLGAVSVGSLSVSFCTFLFSFLLFLTTPEIAGAVATKDPDKVISDNRHGTAVNIIYSDTSSA